MADLKVITKKRYFEIINKSGIKTVDTHMECNKCHEFYFIPGIGGSYTKEYGPTCSVCLDKGIVINKGGTINVIK